MEIRHSSVFSNTRNQKIAFAQEQPKQDYLILQCEGLATFEAVDESQQKSYDPKPFPKDIQNLRHPPTDICYRSVLANFSRPLGCDR